VSGFRLPFVVGSTAWHVGAPYKTTYVTCPECAGKKMVKVIAGTGEQFMLKCHHCGPGYEDPAGVVKQRVPDYSPRMVTLDALVSIYGGRVTYVSNGDGLLDADDMFATREECEARCVVLRAEQAEEIARLDLAVLTRNRDHLAFSVPYWKRQVKELERQLERTRRHLGIAQEKKEATPKRITELTKLRARVSASTAVIAAQARLLAAYRTQDHRRADLALTALEKAKAKLEALSKRDEPSGVDPQSPETGVG
jgi:transcription elongation factor Elf1